MFLRHFKIIFTDNFQCDYSGEPFPVTRPVLFGHPVVSLSSVLHTLAETSQNAVKCNVKDCYGFLSIPY